MAQRDSWFIKVYNDGAPEIFGLGEAGPLPGLSVEFSDSFEHDLRQFIDQFNLGKIELNKMNNDLKGIVHQLVQKVPGLEKYSSILFAFETALLDLINGGDRMIFNNQFLRGAAIPINGLIWMSGMDMMLQQIEIKIQEGFNCLKLKVGGLDFEKECDILQYVRRKYFKKDITLRLDANGAFKEEEAMYKLHELAKFDIHSIEQPLKAGSGELPEICRTSPIPIALDEELIGINEKEVQLDLLKRVQPKYIILKPSLHGGLTGCDRWIAMAEQLKIGWWMTSALESNVGLNAIAQFTAGFNNPLHQGLGTGKIYEDNFQSPLRIKNGQLSHSETEKWDLSLFS